MPSVLFADPLAESVHAKMTTRIATPDSVAEVGLVIEIETVAPRP